MIERMPSNDYGPKISSEEYMRRLVAIHTGEGTANIKPAQEGVALEEMNAAIDCQLGVGFPQDRRDQMWAVRRKQDRYHLWRVFKGWVSRPWDPLGGMFKGQIKAYSGVLTDEDLKAFFAITDEELRRLK